MELNVNQKSVLKVLKDTYKKDTVTRQEINALVDKKVISNPSWLKSDKFYNSQMWTSAARASLRLVNLDAITMSSHPTEPI